MSAGMGDKKRKEEHMTVIAFLKRLWQKKEPSDWSSLCENPHNYEFVINGKKVSITTDIPIRNFKTFLRGKDEETHCSCGEELREKKVAFSLNGSGKTLHRPIHYCPQCDPEPCDHSTLILTIDNQPVFI